jgi:Mrp family chromosome partitioning ATPase
MSKTPAATVLSLGQLLEQQPSAPPPCLVEPGLLPAQGILFVGGEPKVGKSLLVANLALSLAAGSDRLGFPVSTQRRVTARCDYRILLTDIGVFAAGGAIASAGHLLDFRDDL